MNVSQTLLIASSVGGLATGAHVALSNPGKPVSDETAAQIRGGQQFCFGITDTDCAEAYPSCTADYCFKNLSEGINSQKATGQVWCFGEGAVFCDIIRSTQENCC
jgi:hypothetical protein